MIYCGKVDSGGGWPAWIGNNEAMKRRQKLRIGILLVWERNITTTERLKKRVAAYEAISEVKDSQNQTEKYTTRQVYGWHSRCAFAGIFDFDDSDENRINRDPEKLLVFWNGG